MDTPNTIAYDAGLEQAFLLVFFLQFYEHKV